VFDSQIVNDVSQLLDDGSQIDNNGSQIVNKDSQSKNSGRGHQIEDEHSPDLEIISDSTISGEKEGVEILDDSDSNAGTSTGYGKDSLFDLSSDSNPSKSPKKMPNTNIATVQLAGISDLSQKKALKQLKDKQNLVNLERKLHQYSQDQRNGEPNIAPTETELSKYYECPVCKKCFANFSEVEKHNKSAHQVRNKSPMPPAAPTCIIQPTCTIPPTPSTWIHKRKSFESTPLDQQKKIRLQFGPSEIQLENKQDNETITLDTIRLGSIEPVQEIINLDEEENQVKQHDKTTEIDRSAQEKQQHKRKDIVTIMPEGEKFMNGNLKLVVESHELHTNSKYEKLEPTDQFLLFYHVVFLDFHLHLN
jgi:hypothetical protein